MLCVHQWLHRIVQHRDELPASSRCHAGLEAFLFVGLVVPCGVDVLQLGLVVHVLGVQEWLVLFALLVARLQLVIWLALRLVRPVVGLAVLVLFPACLVAVETAPMLAGNVLAGQGRFVRRVFASVAPVLWHGFFLAPTYWFCRDFRLQHTSR